MKKSSLIAIVASSVIAISGFVGASSAFASYTSNCFFQSSSPLTETPQCASYNEAIFQQEYKAVTGQASSSSQATFGSTGGESAVGYGSVSGVTSVANVSTGNAQIEISKYVNESDGVECYYSDVLSNAGVYLHTDSSCFLMSTPAE